MTKSVKISTVASSGRTADMPGISFSRAKYARNSGMMLMRIATMRNLRTFGSCSSVGIILKRPPLFLELFIIETGSGSTLDISDSLFFPSFFN